MPSLYNCVRLFTTPWTVAHQAPLWTSPGKKTEVVACPPPGDLPRPGIEPVSLLVLELQANSLH